MDVGGWKASIHTPCLPVPLHHAQNVNHFSLHFLTSLVWLHQPLPSSIHRNNKLGRISEAARLSSTNPATQSAVFLQGAIARAALWPNQFFFINQSPEWWRSSNDGEKEGKRWMQEQAAQTVLFYFHKTFDWLQIHLRRVAVWLQLHLTSQRGDMPLPSKVLRLIKFL